MSVVVDQGIHVDFISEDFEWVEVREGKVL